MIKIVKFNPNPFHELIYRNVERNREVVDGLLPFHEAVVDSLPGELEALFVCADLQGRERECSHISEAKLLGIRVAEEADKLSRTDLIPPLSATGVILAGDFYARETLDRRGGSGDVNEVWGAFASRCRWVAGVAGNHDLFGRQPCCRPRGEGQGGNNLHFLDGGIANLDGIRIAGVSGIVGNPRKPYRRREPTFVNAVRMLSEEKPDIFVMHEGPDFPALGLRGNPLVREVIENSTPTLVVRGHTHWNSALVTFDNGTQVLNVDARVIYIVRTSRSTG